MRARCRVHASTVGRVAIARLLRNCSAHMPAARRPTSNAVCIYPFLLYMAEIRIVPANEVSWDDIQAVFGTRGDPSRCQCQRFKMAPGESWASVGAVELGRRLREQSHCGEPDSDTTCGLVAFLDGQPVGWCAVEPRRAYRRLLRNNRVPWDGRAEVKHDPSVWAVTCFVTRTGFRGRGITYALARATIDFARQRGARALEG